MKENDHNQCGSIVDVVLLIFLVHKRKNKRQMLLAR